MDKLDLKLVARPPAGAKVTRTTFHRGGYVIDVSYGSPTRVGAIAPTTSSNLRATAR
jgi:hypothetical protein